MSKKSNWIFMIWVAGMASCASAPKSPPPIRETTAEVQAAEPVDATNTEDATQAPDGEISLDGAKSTEVDIGVTGTSTGPVVVDTAIPDVSTAAEPTDAEKKALIEALTGTEPTSTGVVDGSNDIESIDKKDGKKTGKKTVKKAVEEPGIPGQLIIESSDAPSPVLTAP